MNDSGLLVGHTTQFSWHFVNCDANMKIICWTCNVLSVAQHASCAVSRDCHQHC